MNLCESKVPLSCHKLSQQDPVPNSTPAGSYVTQLRLSQQFWRRFLFYNYTQSIKSINGKTILTIISIHILPSYLAFRHSYFEPKNGQTDSFHRQANSRNDSQTWSNHFITELTNHFPFVIQPRFQAFAAATLDLVRHENFKLPNFSDTADFRNSRKTLGKLWKYLKMELVWIGVFTSKFRLRNGVVQRVWV